MSSFSPIHLHSDQLHVSVMPKGGALTAVRLGAEGRNLLVGFADLENHLAIPAYAGVLVGPVANRLARGQLTIDGNRYQMPLNEAGRTTLHSGPDGIHQSDWRVAAQSETEVQMALTLPDGAQGLPGTRDLTVRYAVTGDSLTVEITATSDQPTPMNIALHPYWNLDGTPDISQHRLEVQADHYLPTDAENLPTGTPSPVSGTLYDFTKARPVPLTEALDHNFCLAHHERDTPALAATLTGADGTTLSIETTAPGLQGYAGAFLPAMKGVRDDGSDLAPYAGLALEPQAWPDAPNHPTFPQITLRPGEVWRQLTRYRFVKGS